jgi:predicted transcriptional regulator
MLKNITLSADEALIREARRQAALQNTTLNALFREWLEQYLRRQDAVARYDELMQRLSHVNAGRKFTREEMNERR